MRRALLFGTPYGSLHHVQTSLCHLYCVLTTQCEFETVQVIPDAHRATLLPALDAWIKQTNPGDAAFLGYIGHGGRCDGVPVLQPLQTVPATQDSFPWILGLELGQRLVELAQRTDNVTLLLDCCHATDMISDPTHLECEALQRTLSAQRRKFLPPALERGTRGPRSPLDNIVQLTASAAAETAMEDHRLGISLFVRDLADVLTLCRKRDVQWHEIIDVVRQRMWKTNPTQTPAVAGPRHRVPFTIKGPKPRDDFACEIQDSSVQLDAGLLSGICLDDRFTLRPLGEPAGDGHILVTTELGLQHAKLTPEAGGLTVTDPLPRRAMRVDESPGKARQRRKKWHESMLDVLAAPPVLPPSAYELRWGPIDAAGQLHLLTGAALQPGDGLWISLATLDNRRAREFYFAGFHFSEHGLSPLFPGRANGIVLAIGDRWLMTSQRTAASEDRIAWPPPGPSSGEHSLLFVISEAPLDVQTIASPGLETLRGDQKLAAPPQGAPCQLVRVTITVTCPVTRNTLPVELPTACHQGAES